MSCQDGRKGVVRESAHRNGLDVKACPSLASLMIPKQYCILRWEKAVFSGLFATGGVVSTCMNLVIMSE